jgi:hypothetical protein
MRNHMLGRITSAILIAVLVTALARLTGPAACGIISNTPIFLPIFGVFGSK